MAGCPEVTQHARPSGRRRRLDAERVDPGLPGRPARPVRRGLGPSTAYVGLRNNGAGGGTQLRLRRASGEAELPPLPPHPQSGFERLKTTGGEGDCVECVAETLGATARRGAGQTTASPHHELPGPRVPSEPRA